MTCQTPWPSILSFYKSIGVEGLYTQTATRPSRGDFLPHYVAARLLWDHTADVNALLEEFYQKFYGEAAAPMKRWHEALERQMAASRKHFSGRIPDSGDDIFTPALIEELRRDIAEARGLAKDDLVRRRLEMMAALTEYAARFAECFDLRTPAQGLQGEARRAALTKALQCAEVLHQDTVKPKGVLRNFVEPGAKKLRLPHSQPAAEIKTLKAEIAGKKTQPAPDEIEE